MGLFKRIIKMIFRDTLFRIPKKYLIVIIMFLSVYLLRSNVFASYENYEMIPTDSPAVDCVYYDYVSFDTNNDYLDLHLEANPVYNSEGLDANYWFSIDFKANDRYNSFNLFNINSQDFRLYHDYSGAFAGIRFNWGGNENTLVDLQHGQWGTNLELETSIVYRLMSASSGQFSTFVVTQGETLINSGILILGENYYNADGSLDLLIGPNSRSVDIKNFKVGISNNEDTYRVGLVNGYPCKYLDSSGATLQYIEGYYDIITGCFIVYDGFYFNDNNVMSEPPQEIQDYTPPVPSPSPEPSPIDYTGSIQDVDNSINNLNNNIMNEDTTGIDTSIYTPVATSTEATNIMTIFNTNVNSWINALEDEGRIYSISLYLPNFLNANQPYTIILKSDMLKNALNGVNIPEFNFNAYFIIQVFWYLALGGYLVHLILRLYQAFTDGEITNLSSWSQKINAEYTKISMFII